MANAISVPTNTDGRHDDTRALKRRVRLVTLSGSYANPEVINASDVGLKRLIAVNILNGTASETDLTGAWIVRVDVASTGLSANVSLFEAGTAGGVHTEKPTEAYESAANFLAEFIGY